MAWEFKWVIAESGRESCIEKILAKYLETIENHRSAVDRFNGRAPNG